VRPGEGVEASASKEPQTFQYLLRSRFHFLVNQELRLHKNRGSVITVLSASALVLVE
jgi:hypothetical protein